MTQGYAVGNINAGVNQLACGGRLTLTTGLPVTVSDVTAATNVYFTPYKSGYISLWDGTSTWITLPFAEITIAVPATTSQMYDVFAYNNAGAVACEALAWTNDTTRATALALQNGIYVKSGDATRRYIGSFRTTTVSGQTEDSLAKRYVWNYNNRVVRPMTRVDTTDSWSYTTATWRQANNAVANQLDFIIGVIEDEVSAQVFHRCINSTTTVRSVNAGIGIDVTNANSAIIYEGLGVVNTKSEGIYASYKGFPGFGRHFLAWLEIGAGADAQTWFGDASVPAILQSGIIGSLMG